MGLIDRSASIVVLAMLFLISNFGQPASGQGSGITEAEKQELIRLGAECDQLAKQQKFREAFRVGGRVLELSQKALGENHAIIADLYRNMGNFLWRVGDYGKARAYFEKGLAIERRVLGEEHAVTGRSYNNLAVLLMDIGDYQAARANHERALAIFRKTLGENHVDTSASYNNLGNLLQVQGDLALARSYYEKSLATKKKLLGENHVDVAIAHNNLGALLRDLGDYGAAQAHYEKALTIRRQLLGEEHLDTASTHHNLAILFQNMGDHAAAREHYAAALSVTQKVLGEEHLDTARLHNNLGTAASDQGDDAVARSHHEQALAIRRRILGENHADTAMSYSNLGAVNSRLKDHSVSREYHLQALAIRRKCLGEAHVDTSTSYYNLMLLDASLDAWDTAADWMEHERRSSRAIATRILPTLSEREQSQFLNIDFRRRTDQALSLALLKRESPQIVGLSAGWQLNGKGVGQEALTQRALLGREVRDPSLAPLVTELQQVRAELSKLSLSAPATNEIDRRQRKLSELAEREAAIARNLAQAQSGIKAGNAWVELDAIRKAIAPGACLIDIARFERWRFEDQKVLKAAAQYAAFVIPREGEGEVQLIDLGDAADTETLVQRWRAAIAHSVGAGEVEEVNEIGSQLSERIWKPLASAIGEAMTIYLSPDGPLWLVPWAALPVDGERLLLEERNLRYLISGRDLVSNAGKKEPTPPVIFADPDYDLDARQTEEAAKAVLRSAYSATTVVTGVAAQLGAAARLPGTAVEAAAVQPSIAKLANAIPAVYTERYALECVAKRLVRPRVALFATHGFFLPAQPAQFPDTAPGQQANPRPSPLHSAKTFENPLTRCGLLLTGCNPRNAGHAGSGDDGVLTGMEIVGIDFRGTEMVVLSACQSGIGAINTGEGVAGLRQAFQLAGAQSVVATLWQIPDRDSALIMNDFFANLSKGQSKAEALRGAQLQRIAARKEKYGAAEPFYWAAWTVTGN